MNKFSYKDSYENIMLQGPIPQEVFDKSMKDFKELVDTKLLDIH